MTDEYTLWEARLTSFPYGPLTSLFPFLLLPPILSLPSRKSSYQVSSAVSPAAVQHLLHFLLHFYTETVMHFHGRPRIGANGVS